MLNSTTLDSIAGGVAVGVLAALLAGLAPSDLRAADSPRQRISLDDDWRFVKGDPQGMSVNLTYPTAFSAGRGGQRPDPNSGIAAFILPTGNWLIADPAKRYTRPAGNYGGDVPYVRPALTTLLAQARLAARLWH